VSGCPTCGGTGSWHNGATVPWLEDWGDCPDCNDPALPPEPPEDEE
jgi:hypothetical protein